MDEKVEKSVDAVSELIAKLIADCYRKMILEGIPSDAAGKIMESIAPGCISFLMISANTILDTSSSASMKHMDDDKFFKV